MNIITNLIRSALVQAEKLKPIRKILLDDDVPTLANPPHLKVSPRADVEQDDQIPDPDSHATMAKFSQIAVSVVDLDFIGLGFVSVEHVASLLLV